MHYYEHHLGDYTEATSHLSFVEDAAYSRCIRKYYSTEKPLPGDIKAVQRLVGARTKEEKAAVELVLNEFFELSEDGWRNSRCDQEIARYLDKQAKAARSANARWKIGNSHTEGNANAMRTHTERIPNAVPTQCEGNAPNLQSPISNPNPTSESEAREDAENRLQQRMRKCADFAIPLREAAVQITSMHPVLVAWIDDGFTLQQCLGAVEIARQSKGPGVPIPANYLDKILRDPLPKLNGHKQAPAPRKAKEFGS